MMFLILSKPLIETSGFSNLIFQKEDSPFKHFAKVKPTLIVINQNFVISFIT